MATLAEAQAQVAAYEAASLALASSQAYSIGGRSLTRADLPSILRGLTYWRRVVQGLTAQAAGARHGGVKVAVVPT